MDRSGEDGLGGSPAPAADLTKGPRKRSVLIAGHATSLTLEDAFWTALADIAARQNRSRTALIAEIDNARGDNTLSSALRLYVLSHVR